MGSQLEEPEPQAELALAYEEPLFEIAPAPPLIRRFTRPPQLGHSVMGWSDIF